MRHGRGDSGALLCFARCAPVLAATWLPCYGSRLGFAPSRPETPRGPESVELALRRTPPPKCGHSRMAPSISARPALRL